MTDLWPPCTPSRGRASAVLGHEPAGCASSGPRRPTTTWGTCEPNLSPPPIRAPSKSIDAGSARTLRGRHEHHRLPGSQGPSRASGVGGEDHPPFQGERGGRAVGQVDHDHRPTSAIGYDATFRRTEVGGKLHERTDVPPGIALDDLCPGLQQAADLGQVGAINTGLNLRLPDRSSASLSVSPAAR